MDPVHRVSSRRVVDYFIVIGADDAELLPLTEDSSGNPFSSGPPSLRSPFHAFVTDRYPVEDRPDDELPEGVQLFCLPNGLQLTETLRRPTLHSFIQTNPLGEHLHGFCLTFYERITAGQRKSVAAFLPGTPLPDVLYGPRCLCLLSRWSFPSSFKKVLCGLYYQQTIPQASVPLERYVCNLVDDVPAPSSVRADVTFYMNEQPIALKCPPFNEPQCWSGRPLFPLFECLPPAKVLELFALLLTERQVVFISQQLSLLTACVQAATSLLYPLAWPHALIPVLPRQLIGVLEAPNPFICGIHSTYLKDCSIQAETARVFLDEGRLDVGTDGPPPPLPPDLKKRLQQHILTSAPIFAQRPATWKAQRLPLFDDAFCSLTDHTSKQIAVPARSAAERIKGALKSAAVPLPAGQRELVQERRLRAAFLNFFVSLLQPYKRFLLLGSAGAGSGSGSGSRDKFRFSDFVKENPADWRPFLQQFVITQAFSQFVDERALHGVQRSADVAFFDDAIDVKTGARAGSSSSKPAAKGTGAELPLSALSGLSQRTSRTYVPPSPDASGLPLGAQGQALVFSYPSFPRLSPALFAAPRELATALGAQASAQSLLVPLKRAPGALSSSSSSSSGVACIYSCYIVGVCQLVVQARARLLAVQRAGITTNRVLADYAPMPSVPAARALQQPAEQNYSAAPAPAPEPAPASDEAARAMATLLSEENESDADAALDLVAEAAAETSLLSLSSHGGGGLNSSVQSLGLDVSIDADQEEAGAAVLPSSPEPTTPPPAPPSAPLPDAGGALWRERAEEAEAAARLGLKVAFEALNCLTKLDEAPEDLVFRSLLEACGACGEAASAVDVLAMMQDEGLIPDKAMLGAAAAAAEACASSSSSTAAAAGAGKGAGAGAEVSADEVWTMQDWHAPQRRRGPEATSSLLSRRSKSFAVPPALPKKNPASAPGTLKHVDSLSILRQPSAPSTAPKDPKEPKGSESLALVRPSSASQSAADAPSSPPRSSGSSSGARSPVKKNGAASAKLSRHMGVAETLLEQVFPGIDIDLAHALGTQCPGKQPCPAQRPLTFAEIIRGWTPGDVNGYTTRCPHCGASFVPRFSVSCSAPDFVGSEGPGSPLWCELLSPWTLRKEVLAVLLAEHEGVQALCSRELRDASRRTDKAVVFWNALVAFRRAGLPFAFLLAESDVFKAFPPAPASSSSGGVSTPTK